MSIISIKRAKQITIFLGTTVTFLVVALYYKQIGFIDSFEARTYDMRQKTLRHSIEPNKDIAIIAIDDKSVAELGRFPWSRKYFADLIDYASQAKTKAIFLDVIFSEDQSSDIDRKLALSIKNSGTTTLPIAFEFSQDGSAISMINNIAILASAAKNSSHINIFPDEDGIIRWSQLIIPFEGRLYTSLALTAAMEMMGVDQIEVNDYRVVIGSKTIPTDSNTRMLINYIGPPGTYTVFSFSDVAKGRVAPELLKDKLLFVGATALGIYDMRVTPFSNNSTGVEITASITDNILRGDFMRRGGIETLTDLFFIATLGILVSFITLNLRASLSFPLVLLIAIGYIFFSYKMFIAGKWLSIIYPILSLVMSYSVTAYLRFFYLDKKANEIRSMFSSYVSKKVVDELIKHPELAKISGDNREITIMFSDIKNYTTYSEKHKPEDVVKILNDYLSEMTNVIIEHEGTLDKFLGDGILAYWGAPILQENHAELAVRCAIEMTKKMDQLKRKWEAEGTEPLSFGIGINTGEVIVGNIGAQGKKMEYTVIGDNVNLTYRIQDKSREVNCPVITESLYEKVKDRIIASSMGEIKVRGKKAPFNIYALKEIRI
ncbi:MAG: adenylate/guanylate cyclase domain-containing protein [Thermodesulfobacteriota bacterium]|nr:adenylate/guanylate cyclase domain-containing protein [Thermodesulfobacteriota bacterium]